MEEKMSVTVSICMKGLPNGARKELKNEAKRKTKESGIKYRALGLGIETSYDVSTGEVIIKEGPVFERQPGDFGKVRLRVVTVKPEDLETFRNILISKFGPRPEFKDIARVEQAIIDGNFDQRLTNVYDSKGHIIAFDYSKDGWKLSGVAAHQKQIANPNTQGPNTQGPNTQGPKTK